ncbi:hypothetical protein HH212_19135 [Massilia forsythiae]|uniref:Uncharacterized protein n=1 Tax=Massilia forsythiae TaxID=2728020 RepID=A0A7Z2ZVA0_9BURK|nr:hypothetical protein [Massilia forsythiae]QJE01872.1 hypothetical protein HH212_19135 [Massilia forsythiae]
MTIQFKADVPGGRFQPHWIGDPFICTVMLRRSNVESIYTAFGKCLPNDPSLFRRGGGKYFT